MSQAPPPPLSPPPPTGTSPLGYGAAPAAKRKNGAAIASLVCGIVGCVPFITSLLAVVLGIVGLRKARDPNVGGKTLAIVGVVLGLIGIAGWGLFGGTLYTGYVLSKPARTLAHQFAADLAAGNVDTAAAATAGMSRDELAGVSQQMQPWGALTDVTLPGFNYQANLNGATVVELGGTATFSVGGPKTYTVTLVKQGDTFKIQAFNFK
jgi:hypothetical protein